MRALSAVNQIGLLTFHTDFLYVLGTCGVNCDACDACVLCVVVARCCQERDYQNSFAQSDAVGRNVNTMMRRCVLVVEELQDVESPLLGLFAHDVRKLGFTYGLLDDRQGMGGFTRGLVRSRRMFRHVDVLQVEL